MSGYSGFKTTVVGAFSPDQSVLAQRALRAVCAGYSAYTPAARRRAEQMEAEVLEAAAQEGLVGYSLRQLCNMK